MQIVPYELFATADGWLVLNVGNDSQWRAFCEAAEADDFGADPRYATNRQRVELRGEVVPRVGTIMKGLSTAEWERRLAAANVPHAVVRDYAAIFADPQTAARGMRVTVRDPAGNPVELVGNPVKMSGTSQTPPVMPPRLGEQTAEVLRELAGVDAGKLAELRERGGRLIWLAVCIIPTARTDLDRGIL